VTQLPALRAAGTVYDYQRETVIRRRWIFHMRKNVEAKPGRAEARTTNGSGGVTQLPAS